MSNVKALLKGRYDMVAVSGVLLVMGVAYVMLGTRILSIGSITFLSAQFLPLVLTTVAQAIIMLTGGIDLSVGALVSLVTAVFALSCGVTPVSVVFAVLLALLVGAVAGGINGTLVASVGLPPIIVTLAASFVWAGLALVLLPRPGGSVPSGLVTAYNMGFHGIPLALVLMIVALLSWWWLRRTPFGLSIYAVGGNAQGAYANGIRVKWVRIGAYAVAGMFVALAGISLSIQIGSGDATIGAGYTLTSIAGAVVGGIAFNGGVGKIAGAVMGAFILGILQNILVLIGVSPFYQLVLQGAVLIVAVAVKALANRERDAE